MRQSNYVTALGQELRKHRLIHLFTQSESRESKRDVTNGVWRFCYSDIAHYGVHLGLEVGRLTKKKKEMSFVLHEWDLFDLTCFSCLLFLLLPPPLSYNCLFHSIFCSPISVEDLWNAILFYMSGFGVDTTSDFQVISFGGPIVLVSVFIFFNIPYIILGILHIPFFEQYKIQQVCNFFFGGQTTIMLLIK